MVSPVRHAARGASAALLAATVLSNLLANRKPLLKLQMSSLTFAKPSRNAAALALFIGVFRYLQRRANLQSKIKSEVVPGATFAAAIASGVGTACVSPRTRPALVSLLTTTAASQNLQKLILTYPQLRVLQPLELLAFMAAVGWIFYSGFFHPESYQKSHMRLILKYVLLTQDMASQLQDQYRNGGNPNPCGMRHAGRSCREFARSDFLRKVTREALRLYVPVHISAWIFAQRHAKVRAKPLTVRVSRLSAKVVRSTAYFTTFVYAGWVLSCQMGSFGDRSISHRKLQFFLGGALPSLAIFIESPSRRRPIGLILTSYVLVSMGSVAFRRVKWLQPGANPARGLLEAGCVAAAVAATISGSLESNHWVRRVLLGDIEARALQDELRRRTEAEEDIDLAETAGQ